MKFLLDTCVLSEIKQAHPDAKVLKFIRQLDPDKTFLSVLTMGELSQGIHLLESGKKKTALEIWLDGIETHYSGRVLPLTMDIAKRWGRLSASAKQQGVGLPVVDGLIAATAIHHGMHLVTRNISDFKVSGVPLINPWERA